MLQIPASIGRWMSYVGNPTIVDTPEFAAAFRSWMSTKCHSPAFGVCCDVCVSDARKRASARWLGPILRQIENVIRGAFQIGWCNDSEQRIMSFRVAIASKKLWLDEISVDVQLELSLQRGLCGLVA